MTNTTLVLDVQEARANKTSQEVSPTLSKTTNAETSEQWTLTQNKRAHCNSI